MKSKKIVALVLAAALVTTGSAVAGTKAWFTSKAEPQKSEFNSGTLILGGVMDGQDVANKFKTLEFKNMQPGKPYSLGKTTLKNVGSLPMKIYRITASNFKGAPELLDDDNVIVNMDMIQKDGTKTHAYTGRLGNLTTENGGYFNPIYNIQPKETVDMEVSVMIAPTAGNKYQEKESTCDLTVYAAQTRMPNNGEPVGTEYMFQGPKTVNAGDPTFTVTGVDDGKWLNFTYNWQPWDLFEVYRHNHWWGSEFETKDFELYHIGLKLASDQDNNHIDTVNLKIVDGTKIGHFIEIDTVTGYEYKLVYTNPSSKIQLHKGDVKVDFDNNTISIRKAALPKDWRVCEVQFGGIQREGLPPVFTDYQQMSLNKVKH